MVHARAGALADKFAPADERVRLWIPAAGCILAVSEEEREPDESEAHNLMRARSAHGLTMARLITG